MFRLFFKPKKKAISKAPIFVNVEPGDTEEDILRKSREKFFSLAAKHNVGRDTKVPIYFKIEKDKTGICI